MKKENAWTTEVALSNLYKWCALQDRCHMDARTKLIQHQIYGHELEEIITHLISEGFLNEERYARAYARGKYRIKRWGRNKIVLGLKQKQISAYCIKKALTEIDDEEYHKNLTHIIERKTPLIKASNKFEFKKKMTAFLIQKGYQYGEFLDLIDDIYLYK